jgi:hypothetical protein
MQEQIKKLRVQIDGYYQLTKELKPIDRKPEPLTIEMVNSKEVNDAAYSLLYSKAWLGKVLEALGTENPYGNGYKTKEDIVPTQDVSNGQGLFKDNFELLWWKNELNHIEKVDWLRCSIEDTIKNLLLIESLFTGHKTREFSIARTNCYNHLCEAKFALGFELARVREENV